MIEVQRPYSILWLQLLKKVEHGLSTRKRNQATTNSRSSDNRPPWQFVHAHGGD